MSKRSKALSYERLYDIACKRKGSEANLEDLLQNPLSKHTLSKKPDALYLSELCKKIFQSGFVWRVVEAKWPEFEELFWGFDVDKLIMMPDEMLEKRAQDKRLIRNNKKIWAIRENALMIDDLCRRENTSFAKFVANWPEENITDLWLFLKKHGCRLGGNTGPYALRSLGKDTFLLTRDVEGYLRENKVIDTGINTKSALQNTQHFFNELQQQSGRSLTELSQLVAMSYGANRVGVQH